MGDATGESESGGLRLDFDRRLKLEFHGATVTSDAGLLAFRELDDALGLTALASDLLVDPRTGKNGRHTLLAQFRQGVFGRLAGYQDVNDADRTAGSRPSRSASFTSWYPASRPNTPWRNWASKVWRPFFPVRGSTRRSLARAVRPSASSSSRNASRPASEVTVAPWNSSFKRRSKSSRRPPLSLSPVASPIRRPLRDHQTLALHSRFARQRHRAARSSGKCGLKGTG